MERTYGRPKMVVKWHEGLYLFCDSLFRGASCQSDPAALADPARRRCRPGAACSRPPQSRGQLSEQPLLPSISRSRAGQMDDDCGSTGRTMSWTPRSCGSVSALAVISASGPFWSSAPASTARTPASSTGSWIGITERSGSGSANGKAGRKTTSSTLSLFPTGLGSTAIEATCFSAI